ncbi:glutathione peroxidase [Prochlorococcus marinus]|uniref:Glutathione peroxidase n=1 Tax=Prochlorococcus marinus XMU1408 TaxID=2213228 RepID=A0A318R294_PROMR|nr:glutathione peroxidase [Prochlorococcus marinus]MBW3042858.1 glutathione peroxidase [Prochlorococcus marinus str. XMU1408]PYE00684.1 glutathione peroxidase [Prochlorococcus marinus XMU1408]
MSVNISKVEVFTFENQKITLDHFKGKVLLIVNVASKCGFTKQYKALQNLQDTYESQGFRVLGFPCNDFGNQEPGELEEIKEFCSVSFGASFQLFQKIHAKGNTTEPFSTLNKVSPAGDVEWNFEKFLIDRKGDAVARFKSSIEPESIEIKQEIERLLN